MSTCGSVEMEMNDKRRECQLKNTIFVNSRQITNIIIDPHVDKHRDHINDDLIINLVETLDGKEYLPTSCKEGYDYFLSNITLGKKVFRLVWLLEEECVYIGVITAFKDGGAQE